MSKYIFLADDDADDRLLFEDALRELNSKTRLTIAQDGVELLDILNETVPPPPDVIFLDLNMPRKNGFECLEEIKQKHKLKDIPVVILSTSSQESTIDQVYEQGAHYYIRKPNSYKKLKALIEQVLSIDWTKVITQPPKEEFLLSH
jgi:CheY-like chemotaxis protein